MSPRPPSPEIALIQGSISPGLWLLRGEVKVVPYTRHIKKMADRGVIVILARRPYLLRSSDA